MARGEISGVISADDPGHRACIKGHVMGTGPAKSYIDLNIAIHVGAT
jgi:hypothetical protein